MDCYRHEGTPSEASCVGCRQPICKECAEEVAGHPMCQPCVAAAQARLAQPQAPWLSGVGSTSSPPAAASGSAAAPFPTTVGPLIRQPTTATTAAGISMEGVAPGPGRRIARGMFWGILYGQWWTLWTIVSEFMWGHGSVDAKFIFGTIVIAVIFGFFGSLTGLIIGAINAPMRTGVAIGVGMGVVLCLGEAVLSHDASSMVNLLFYFFTGRFVGAGITGRVQQPVR